MCILHTYIRYTYLHYQERAAYILYTYVPTYCIVRLYTHTYVDIYMHF